MNVEKTTLDGVLLITPPTIFEDARGVYVETYNRRLYSEAGIDQDFIQDDISVSKKNVLRGIHGDAVTWKLISCPRGEFMFVVVNNDPASGQYKKWEIFILSGDNRLQVLVPPLFGNGHLVLIDQSVFHYKQTSEYDREGQFTIPWNDPELGIDWPISNPITSARDVGDADA